MKAGDKLKAEHNGLPARSTSRRTDVAAPGTVSVADPELVIVKPKPAMIRPAEMLPDMPWKKNKS
jgi:hypothetical protein